MKIYLVGISCVGKTTIGRLLANYLDFSFYDLDDEVQKYYHKPIEIIQNECFTMNKYRQKASVVLDRLLKIQDNSIISGTPSGLRDSYLQIYKKHKKEIDIISVNIIDTPENILDRLTFYDVNSKLLDIELDDNEKKKYLKEIIGDLNYFKKSLSRADLQISIENISLAQIPELIVKELIDILPSLKERDSSGFNKPGTVPPRSLLVRSHLQLCKLSCNRLDEF